MVRWPRRVAKDKVLLNACSHTIFHFPVPCGCHNFSEYSRFVGRDSNHLPANLLLRPSGNSQNAFQKKRWIRFHVSTLLNDGRIRRRVGKRSRIRGCGRLLFYDFMIDHITKSSLFFVRLKVSSHSTGFFVDSVVCNSVVGNASIRCCSDAGLCFLSQYPSRCMEIFQIHE